MHCVLGLLLTSLCGVFGTPEVHKTAAAWFRQTERYYCSILERFILQKFIVKAPSGFRVTFKCYQRSSETSEPILHAIVGDSYPSIKMNSSRIYMNLLATHMNSTKLDLRGTMILSI